MTVRRLHSVQPPSFAFSPANLAWAKAQLAKFPEGKQASAVVPILWRVQEQEGWVSEPALRAVADLLGMAYIRVYEVATFYTMFQLAPVGSKAHVQVCGTTPCMLRGSLDLIKACKERIHPDPHHLNDDGTLSWEEVECLGSCANAPMVQIGSDTYEDLNPDLLHAVIRSFESGQTGEARLASGARRFVPVDGSDDPHGLRRRIQKAAGGRCRRNVRSHSARRGRSSARIGRRRTAASGEAVSAAGSSRRTSWWETSPSAICRTPILLKAPRNNKADDLKLICGHRSDAGKGAEQARHLALRSDRRLGRRRTSSGSISSSRTSAAAPGASDGSSRRESSLPAGGRMAKSRG